jgi:D-serine deaminase-like pyridoxal phosphate-dependent protein
MYYLAGTAKTLLPALMFVSTGFLGLDRAKFFQLRYAMGPTSTPPLASLSSRPPAKVGQALADILTPSLIVKEGALAYNLARVHDAIKGNGTPAAVRPHGKAHKCVALAHRQVESGCVGVCAAKIGEAEMFLHGGIKDVLLTNQIVGQNSADRYAQLVARHRDAKVAVCVDSEEGVQELSSAASKFDVALNVLVEVNVGQDRGGVEAEGALNLALSILRAAPSVQGGAGLLLAGVQGYMGLNQHVRTRKARDAASAKVAEILRGVVSNLEANGVRVSSVTGAGTGTFQGEALQVGCSWCQSVLPLLHTFVQRHPATPSP